MILHVFYGCMKAFMAIAALFPVLTCAASPIVGPCNFGLACSSFSCFWISTYG